MADPQPRLLPPGFFLNRSQSGNERQIDEAIEHVTTDAAVAAADSSNGRTETVGDSLVAGEPVRRPRAEPALASRSLSSPPDASYIHGPGAMNITGGNINIGGNVNFGGSTTSSNNPQSPTSEDVQMSARDEWSFRLYVQSKIGRDIWTLASMLEIDEAKVEFIRSDFVRDLSGACGAILKKYKEQWRGSAADAKRNLIRVLRDEPLRRNDIADILATQ